MHPLITASIKTLFYELATRYAKIAAAIKHVGYPSERIYPGCFAVLLLVIVGQLLSVKASALIFSSFAALVGGRHYAFTGFGVGS